jgi:hypothetical protein
MIKNSSEPAQRIAWVLIFYVFFERMEVIEDEGFIHASKRRNFNTVAGGVLRWVSGQAAMAWERIPESR